MTYLKLKIKNNNKQLKCIFHKTKQNIQKSIKYKTSSQNTAWLVNILLFRDSVTNVPPHYTTLEIYYYNTLITDWHQYNSPNCCRHLHFFSVVQIENEVKTNE